MLGTACNLNPLKTELNPICHLLVLLGAHHILHISRIRVNVTGFIPLRFICKISHKFPILIRSIKMQQYAGIYLLQNHSVHISGVHRTHHQENIKL